MNEPFVRDRVNLLVGDVCVLLVSFALAVFLRRFEVPTLSDASLYLPLVWLMIVHLIIFVGSGLYDKRVALFEQSVMQAITGAQVVYALCSILYFFLFPGTVGSRVVLILYFVISSILLVLWRQGAFAFAMHLRGMLQVIVVGAGQDINDLVAALDATPQALLKCASYIDSTNLSGSALRERISEEARVRGVRTIVADVRLDIPPELEIIDARVAYEVLFERTPLTLFNPGQMPSGVGYRLAYVVKRVLESLLAVFILFFFALILPIIALAMRIEGRGPVFIEQERIGKGWSKTMVRKLRTMRQNKSASSEWTTEEKTSNPVTKVGAFLRRTSLDEVPQLLSVLTGELSLVGPRSDIRGLGERLEEELPFYRLRYAVTPGISGWAQVNQRYAPGQISPQSIEDSRVRLMYDLYYVTHYSLLFDLSIILKTLKTLLQRLIP